MKHTNEDAIEIGLELSNKDRSYRQSRVRDEIRTDDFVTKYVEQYKICFVLYLNSDKLHGRIIICFS